MTSVLLDGMDWFAGLKVPQEPSPKCHVPAMCTTSTTMVHGSKTSFNFHQFLLQDLTISCQIIRYLPFLRICIPSVQLEWVVGIGGEQNLGQLFRLPAVYGSRHWKGQSKSNYTGWKKLRCLIDKFQKSFKSHFLIIMLQCDVVRFVSSNTSNKAAYTDSNAASFY